jgi:hypothetical protein
MPPHNPGFPASSSGLIVLNSPVDGTGPVRLLFSRLSISSVGELPKLLGISPERKLLERSRTDNVGIMAIARDISYLPGEAVVPKVQ